MNPTDRDELRCLIEKAVKPTYQAATHAVEAVAKVHQEVAELRVELNGAGGIPGIKERLRAIETRCVINHDPETTAQREAITVDRARRALREREANSVRPRSRSEHAAASMRPEVKQAMKITAAALGVVGGALTLLTIVGVIVASVFGVSLPFLR